MEIISTYGKETPDEIIYARVIEWIADERFFYNELSQLVGLAAQKEIRSRLSEQMQKDVICNLKSMLNVLLEDLRESQKKLSGFLTDHQMVSIIAPRETYLSIMANIGPIRKKIWLLKLRTLEFLGRKRFPEGRNYIYRYASAEQKREPQLSTKLTKRKDIGYRTFRTKNPPKMYKHEFKSTASTTGKFGDPSF